MKQILFVCSGNKYRSPMAEAFFNRLAEQQSLPVRATSAGLNVLASRASEKALEAAKSMVRTYPGNDRANSITR